MQLTPPGSPSSIMIGKGFTSAVPGSVQGTFLVVDDLEAARGELVGRGVDVATMTELLRETEERHGGYEATAPKHHWSEWYAAYIVARERGKASDEAANLAALQIEGTDDRGHE